MRTSNTCRQAQVQPQPRRTKWVTVAMEVCIQLHHSNTWSRLANLHCHVHPRQTLNLDSTDEGPQRSPTTNTTAPYQRNGVSPRRIVHKHAKLLLGVQALDLSITLPMIVARYSLAWHPVARVKRKQDEKKKHKRREENSHKRLCVP